MLLSASAAASAGEIAETVKATIGISVNIPARIEVRSSAAVPVARLVGSKQHVLDMCIASNAKGLGYNVAILGAFENPHQERQERDRLVVDWIAAGSRTRLLPGVSAGGFTAAKTCSEEGSAQLVVRTGNDPPTPGDADTQRVLTLVISPG